MRNGEWTARVVAQIVGWALIFFGVVFVFGGFVGEGGGAANEPGTDTIRALIFQSGAGHAAAVAAALGIVVLLASLFMPRRESP